jgi:hypothetical protein
MYIEQILSVVSGFGIMGYYKEDSCEMLLRKSSIYCHLPLLHRPNCHEFLKGPNPQPNLSAVAHEGGVHLLG